MRIKYNSVIENSINFEPSYIRKYLGSEIETLLNPEANSIHGIDFDSIYVNMPSIEAQIAPLKKYMDSDRCIFLTGLTGCGKSSVLNHTFHINVNNRIHIMERSLYILFSFDHAIAARSKEEVTTYFINTIKEVSEKIKDELDKEQLETTDNAFFEYIKEIRGDDLQYSSGTQTNKLDALLEKDEIEYCTLQLKYYLSVLKEINHVVLVVDDIESVGYQMELLPIDLGLTLWSCFKRQPSKTPKVWSSGLVISCRHYVYRMILKHSVDSQYIVKSLVDSQTLESYPINDEINIPKAVKLSDIIKKRVPALSSLKTGKRWDETWAVVNQILMGTDDKFGDLIAGLCINDTRKSLNVLKQVVLNKRWIQRDGKEETPGAFNINTISGFNLSPPCLLRAIALDEGNVYSEDSIIPNILYNTLEPASDLIILVILKAFLKKSNERAISWRISIDREVITQDLKKYSQRKINRMLTK